MASSCPNRQNDDQTSGHIWTEFSAETEIDCSNPSVLSVGYQVEEPSEIDHVDDYEIFGNKVSYKTMVPQFLDPNRPLVDNLDGIVGNEDKASTEDIKESLDEQVGKR